MYCKGTGGENFNIRGYARLKGKTIFATVTEKLDVKISHNSPYPKTRPRKKLKPRALNSNSTCCLLTYAKLPIIGKGILF